MQPFYPPYDFLIVLTATATAGWGIKKFFKVNEKVFAGLAQKVPFAIAYILITLIIAFITENFP